LTIPNDGIKIETKKSQLMGFKIYERNLPMINEMFPKIKISLKACRVNADKSQKEWAEMNHVSQNTVNNWENGNTEPSASQLAEISRLSGIPMDFIFIPKSSQ